MFIIKNCLSFSSILIFYVDVIYCIAADNSNVCPNNYIRVEGENTCIKYAGELTFTVANTTCIVSHGGGILVPHNIGNMDIYFNTLQLPHSKRNVWLGLKYDKRPKQLSWYYNDHKETKIEWKPQVAASANPGVCVVKYVGDNINVYAAECRNSEHDIICEADAGHVSHQYCSSHSHNTTKWINNKCYYFNPDRHRFGCLGYLLLPNSLEELTRVENAFSSQHTILSYLLNGHLKSPYPPAYLLYLNGHIYTGAYPLFVTGYPIGRGKCVRYNATVNKWQDMICDKDTGDTICQRDMVCSKGYGYIGKQCIPCAEDHYKDKTGNTECSPCPEAHYTNGSTGNTECTRSKGTQEEETGLSTGKIVAIASGTFVIGVMIGGSILAVLQWFRN